MCRPWELKHLDHVLLRQRVSTTCTNMAAEGRDPGVCCPTYFTPLLSQGPVRPHESGLGSGWEAANTSQSRSKMLAAWKSDLVAHLGAAQHHVTLETSVSANTEIVLACFKRTVFLAIWPLDKYRGAWIFLYFHFFLKVLCFLIRYFGGARPQTQDLILVKHTLYQWATSLAPKITLFFI